MARATSRLQLEAAFETATLQGFMNQSLIDVGLTIDSSEGLVLGDAEAGQGGTGIDLTTVPRMRAKASRPGSRSKQDDFFVQEDIGTFSFQAAIAGARTATTTPTPAELQPPPGAQALLEAAGLIGQNGTNEYEFVPGNPVPMCAMVWDGGDLAGNKVGVRTAIQDALVGTLVLEYASGAVPTAAATIVGAVTPDGVGTPNPMTRELLFPVPTYGPQADIPPELVAAVDGIWTSDVGAFSRCFQTLTISIDQQVADVQDSCAIDGLSRIAGAQGLYTMAGTMICNIEDFDAEWDAMVRAQTAIATFTFQIGNTAPTSGNLAKGHRVECNGIRVTSLQTVEVDETGLRGLAFEAELTDGSALGGGEFLLAFI